MQNAAFVLVRPTHRGWAALAALATAAILASGCGGAQGPGAVVAPGPGPLVVPERAGAVLDATEHYGPLIVRTTAEDGEGAVARTMPWSSYWYPIFDDLLVKGSPRNGGQSTLEKYDRYAAKELGRASGALSFEKDAKNHLYDPNAGGSDGRCNAWAIASVLEPEPFLPEGGVTVNGVTFYTRDVKALMIKSYERIDQSAVRRFGGIYMGGGDDYQDIYPDQFHRVLQAELYGKRQPVIMDSSAGPEIWNVVVWQANTWIAPDADARVLHVRTALLAAKSTFVDPDYSGGGSRSQNMTLEYTYDLYGLPQADGSFLVQYGKWTGRSHGDHPDYLIAVPEKGTRIQHASLNRELDGKLIEEILNKTGAVSRR